MPLYWISFLLPGMDGLAVLEQVRAKRCKTAIMMLTAVDTVPKILQAFDLGADDYLVKPFLLEILLARLTAIARRGQSTPVPPLLPVGDLILDRSRRSVRRAGRSIHLTRKQFGLLELHWRTWFRRDEPRYWRGGDDYAHNRLVCGVHYPSDIEASRRVAYAVFGYMLATPRFQRDLAQRGKRCEQS